MIPIYYLTLNPEDKINFVSIVDNPANEMFFEKLSQVKERFSLDSEKQIITGLIISPDTPIYRKKGDKEYYIAFNEDSIKQIAKKIIDNPSAVDIQHNGLKVDDVHLLEIYIKDSVRNINPKGFDSVPDGSLFASYKIDNPGLWEGLKTGLFGFSIDGLFHLELPESEDSLDDYKEIYEILNKLKNVK